MMTSQTAIEEKKRSLQQKVQRFLSEEQKQMSERIRLFTEEEHSRFAATQLQIRRNEESLYRILDDIAAKLRTDQILDQNLAKQLNIVENVDKDLGLNPYMSDESTQSLVANPKPFADNKQKKSQSIRYRSQSVDYESLGGIFDIDVDDENAFDSISYSDEEEDIDSIAFKSDPLDYNNSYNKNGTNIVPNAQQINAQNNGQHVAYSLPIQVPKWNSFHNHNDDIDEDEEPMIPNGQTIAESIKKLAKSVRNESDIFGDRPRRRTNTFGDLIKSRPL